MSAFSEYMDDWNARHPGAAEEMRKRIDSFHAEPVDDNWEFTDPSECTIVHREPAGPNEDLAQCPKCWSMTFALRPEGETFGWHLDDCSLPMRHEGYCQPGGNGHVVPPGEKIRGYWPAPKTGETK